MSKATFIKSHCLNDFCIAHYYHTFGLEDRATAESELRDLIQKLCTNKKKAVRKWAKRIHDSGYLIFTAASAEIYWNSIANQKIPTAPSAEIYWNSIANQKAALSVQSGVLLTMPAVIANTGDGKKKRVSEGVESEVPKRQKKDNDARSGNEECGVGGEEDIWAEWTRYMADGQADGSFHKHSPEQHGVIWCGRKIKQRPQSPKLPPYKTFDTNAIEFQPQDEDTILKAPSLKSMRSALAKMNPEDNPELEMFKDISEHIVKFIYSNVVDLLHSEVTYNYYCIWPCLQKCAELVSETANICTMFSPGEEVLEAMQRKNCKKYAKYLADGVIRLPDIGNLEVVLLETSQAYSMATETKKSFDLHKATFGLLAMLRAIAVLFPKGTFNTFRQLRLFFVHPAQTSVRLWSISCPSKDTFVMVCEERVAVPVDFRYKEKQLKQFVSLWIHLSRGLLDTCSILQRLRSEQSAGASEIKLTDIVKPRITKISEHAHAGALKDDGAESQDSSPNASPEHP